MNYDGGSSKPQLVGLRFNSLSIPAGAIITNAYIQFHTDEIDLNPVSLVITGEDTDNAITFTTINANISSRTRTLSSIEWSPAAWTTVGSAGFDQKTPDISAVIQPIINRVGWAAGNSLAIIFSGDGERTAVAFESDSATAPLLHVEYSTSGDPVNLQPVVNAGSDQTITLPNTATLNGTATDDDQPNGTLTTSWSKVSGPGTVSFNNPNSADTSVDFSQAGTYVFELTANDGLLLSTDEVTITVNAEQPVNTQPTVNAGLNKTIILPNTVTLNATVTDDGLPNGTLITSWNMVSGPGTVSFNNSNSIDTTASFSMAGSYVLELRANDSLIQSSDRVTITVENMPEPELVSFRSVADTFINENNQGYNYNGRSELVIGANKKGKIKKGLIKFDISSIPSGATITSVVMRLNTKSTKNTPPTIGVYQILKTWKENTATWENMSSDSNYSSTRLAVATPITDSWAEWTLANSLIQDWVDGDSQNNGVALKYEGSISDTKAKLISRNDLDSSKHPQLVIEYMP